jgi:hypothetical protein
LAPESVVFGCGKIAVTGAISDDSGCGHDSGRPSAG